MGFIVLRPRCGRYPGEYAAKQAASAQALEADVGPKPSSTCCDAGKMGWPQLRSRPGYLPPAAAFKAGRERWTSPLLPLLRQAGRGVAPGETWTGV